MICFSIVFSCLASIQEKFSFFSGGFVYCLFMKKIYLLPVLSAACVQSIYDGPEQGYFDTGFVSYLAAECHDKVMQLEPNFLVVRQNANVSPVLRGSDDKVFFTDGFIVPQEHPGAFLQHTGAYLSSAGQNQYCFGKIDPLSTSRSFEIEFNLSKEACGDLDIFEEEKRLKVFIYHDDGGECTALYSRGNAKAAVFNYEIWLNLEDLSSSTVKRDSG